MELASGAELAALLRRLDKHERIALGAMLNGSLTRMAHAATCTLSNYRERHLLRWYADMIAETSDLADALRRL